MSWYALVPTILSHPPHMDLEVPIGEVFEPSQEGIGEALGEFHGQQKDYEINLPDDMRVHIRKFARRYLAHWDIASPSRNAVEHLRRDAPHWYVAATGSA